MNEEVPVLQSYPPGPSQQRLSAFYNEVEQRQLEFLNEAGKRIIELSTALLGVLFTVSAFGDKFPPAYLVNNYYTRVLVLLTLVGFFLALCAGLMTVQPRTYTRWENNLTENRKELDRVVHYKIYWFRIGSILFGLASFCLVTLVSTIIFVS